jgi:Flp pilus assembly protein TadB
MSQQNQTSDQRQPGQESKLSIWLLALALVPVAALLFMRPTTNFNTNMLMVAALWAFVFLCWFMADKSRNRRISKPD